MAAFLLPPRVPALRVPAVRLECRGLPIKLFYRPDYMDPSEIFINKFGRLRSGWRVVLFVLIYLVLHFTIGSISFYAVFYLGRRVGSPVSIENFAFRAALLSSALIAAYICTRLVEGLPWRALGLALHQNWLIHFLLGSAIGAGSLVLAAAIAATGGGLRFSFAGGHLLISVLKALITSGALFILAALAEEALFRGYPLQTFCRARLHWFGVLLTSAAFAAVHLDNPNVVQGLTFLNTALAGVWFAVAYLRTRSLWFPWGLHWAWNWTLDAVLGLPVSGMKISSHSLFTGSDLGPAWLTGGRYGIEGGIAGTVALVVSTIVVWRIRTVSADPEMLLLTSQENATSTAVSVVPRESA